MNNHQTGKTTEQKTAPLFVRLSSNLACLSRNGITLTSTLDSMRNHAVFVSFEELVCVKAHNSEVGYVY